MSDTPRNVGTPRIIPVGEELPPMLTNDDRAGTGRGVKQGRKGSRHAADRFSVINAFVDCSLGSLRRNEMAVWLILWRDTKGGTARTGQTDIARRAGISARTVRRAIGRLRRCGLLVLVYRGGLNRGTSVYRVEPHRTDGRRGQAGVLRTEDKPAH